MLKQQARALCVGSSLTIRDNLGVIVESERSVSEIVNFSECRGDSIFDTEHFNLPCDGNEPYFSVSTAEQSTILNMAQSSYSDGGMKTEHIYVIKNELTGNIKIGVSVDPDKRLKGLQTGSDGDLTLISSVPVNDAYKVENSIHKDLSQYRVRGEWFKVCYEKLYTVMGVNGVITEEGYE